MVLCSGIRCSVYKMVSEFLVRRCGSLFPEVRGLIAVGFDVASEVGLAKLSRLSVEP